MIFIAFDVLIVVVSPGSETNDLRCAATSMGRFLRQVSETYDSELSRVDNSGDNYERFRTACDELLRSTVDQITQILLVFASYVRLSRAQNVGQETPEYVGQYFSDVGLQSWIQLQGGWVSCNNSHFCITSITAVYYSNTLEIPYKLNRLRFFTCNTCIT